MNIAVSNLRTLVLNADMQPLSWAPLSAWSWQQALVAVLQERVVLLRAYDDILVHSATRPFEVPAVVALKSYRRKKKVSFTRYHLFLRDLFTCQYCGRQFPAKELTFDHVMPRSRSGGSSWDNIVTACGPDNLRKGARTPKEAGMRLLRQPYEPTPRQIDAAARQMPLAATDLHKSWMDFLYWGSELES